MLSQVSGVFYGPLVRKIKWKVNVSEKQRSFSVWLILSITICFERSSSVMHKIHVHMSSVNFFEGISLIFL